MTCHEVPKQTEEVFEIENIRRGKGMQIKYLLDERQAISYA